MTSRLERIRSTNPDHLADIARQALDCQECEMLDWSAAPIDHHQVIETTGGVYRFKGQARVSGETRDWSAVLKIVRQPEDDCLEEPGLCYWRREPLAYGSGLLAALPGGLRAPRCFGVQEDPALKEGWIWLEDVATDQPAAWGLDHFRLAAERLGQFGGAYLTGAPLPHQPWLCDSLFDRMLSDDDWWARVIHTAHKDSVWLRPAVQRVYDSTLRDGVMQIWSKKSRLLSANRLLPRVLCHNDTNRRNLMLSGSGEQSELILIDWGFCGVGAVGSDLGLLVATSLAGFDVDPSLVEEFEAAAWDGYLEGLRQAGWTGDIRLVRLGYSLAVTLYWGATLPHAIRIALPDDEEARAAARYGRPLAEVLSGWRSVASFALERAGEAMAWMTATGLDPG